MSASKIAFTSDDLPAELDDRARFSLWWELCNELFCAFEFGRPEDRPFSVKLEYASLGKVGLGRFSGTVNRVVRTARDIANDGNDDFCFGLNVGRGALAISQTGKSFNIGTGNAALFLHSEASDVRGAPSGNWITLNLPRQALVDLVDGAEDLTGMPHGPGSEVMRHLQRYVHILMGTDGIPQDPSLCAHVETTLIDLVALTLGVNRDIQELAKMRGLRAARLQAILASVKLGFCDPMFSVRDVAVALGLTPRYVQNLLSETDASFSERVLELRLQKARTMLMDWRSKMKVSNIAYACGFSEVSYFNRCFRRRFGVSPTQYRGGNGNDAEPVNL